MTGRWGVGVLAAALLVGAAGAQSPRLAPDFTRSDLSQHAVSLRRLRGHVVLLNFWATWCGPCLAEMPVFAQWQREYASRGLQVVGVSMDDDAAPVKKVAARLALDYPVVIGDARLGKAYGDVLGLPVTFLIGRDGAILKRYDGAADLKAVERDVESALRRR